MHSFSDVVKPVLVGGHSGFAANSSTRDGHPTKRRSMQDPQIKGGTMATNPRIPSNGVTGEPRRGPQLVPGPAVRPRPGSSVPGVLAVIIVAIALTTAIVYYMPRVPKVSPSPSAAEVPTQPSGSQLQFSTMRMVLAPTGGALNLNGEVMNTGNRPIFGAMVRLTFHDASGAIVGTATAPLEGMTMKGQMSRTDNFSTDPLNPNATRPFHVTASRIPAGWNHNLPEMQVLTVSAEGSR